MQNTALFTLLAILATASGIAVPYAHAQDSSVQIIPAKDGECGDAEKCFVPDTITINAGDTITWTNAGDSSQTTVTSGSIDDGPDGVIDSKLIAPGEEFSQTFNIAGTHSYFSMIQPWMTGTITVQAAVADVDATSEPAPSAETGGCLVATAAYGSELAPQVQQLREIRDDTLLSTESGTAFMQGFNQAYYSFSPAVADLQRASPEFREAVKLVITPMLSTLSIMTLAESGSESDVLALGISVIALNLGMYVAAPAAAGLVIHRKLRPNPGTIQ